MYRFMMQDILAARSLPCACAYVALFARRPVYNHYASAHANSAANTHAQSNAQAC